MLTHSNRRLELTPLLEFSLQKLTQGVLWLDARGNVLWMNDSYQQWSGYSADDPPNSIFELSPTLNFYNWKNGWKELVEVGYLLLETQHLHHTGTLYPVRSHVHMFQKDEQTLACCIIDDKLRSDRHRELLTTVTEAFKMGAWEWDDLNHNFWATDNFYDLLYPLQRTPVTLENWRAQVSSVVAAPYADQLIQLLQQTLIDGTSFSINLQLKQGGDPVKVMTHAVVTKEKVIKLYGIVQDTKQEQEQLQQLRSAKFALDQAQEPIVWVNNKANIIYANAAAARLWGYSISELLRMKVTNIASYFETHDWETHWQSLQKQRTLFVENKHKHRDGHQIPVEVSINYFEMNNQQFYCAFIHDVSTQKRKDQELHIAYEEIRALKERYELENIYLKEEIRASHNFNEIITQNKSYQKILAQIGQVATTDATVLITGETGTGKELLARAIHRLSKRVKRPLIKVNCAALPPNLIESELFGHEKGAFTGAIRRKIGRFELANSGTIFLDEIGEMPLDVQAKLLRTLQEGEFERVGSAVTQRVDIRVIAATNRDLPRLVEEGKFRQDLFYRLNVFPIHNLPLRERKDDVPLLVEHFMRKYGEKIGKKITHVAKSFMDKLLQYNFPGNIRELENLIERAIILSDTAYLNLEQWAAQPTVTQPTETGFRTFAQMQYDYIIQALEHTNWKVSGKEGAAELLGLNPKTLESKMRKMNIRRQDFMDMG